MRKWIGIIIGALLIGYGVLELLRVFGFADVQFSLEKWWALAIILPCLNGLFTKKNKLTYFVGTIFGVLLLLAAQNVIAYEMILNVAAPVILVALGIKFIAKSTGKR